MIKLCKLGVGLIPSKYASPFIGLNREKCNIINRIKEREEISIMKFNKLVAALSAVTMLGSLAVAVPASAAEEITVGTTITGSEQTAWKVQKNAAQSSGDDVYVQKQSGNYKDEVRISSKVSSTSVADTLSMGVFDLGKITKGETVKVTVKLKASAGDLTGIGLYAAAAGKTDPNEILSGTALSKMGGLRTTNSNAWPWDTTVIERKVSTFTGCGSSFVPGDANTGTVNELSYTATNISADNELYFIGAAWTTTTDTNVRNRKLQIVSFSVDHLYPTLEAAVNGSADGDVINVPNDQGVPSARITVGKNLTIKSDTNDLREVTVVKNNTAGGLLLNQNRILTLENISVSPLNGTLDGGRYTLGVELGTLNMTNGTITGDAKISKTGTLSLTNVTVSGKVYIDNVTNKSTLKADSNTTIGEIELAGAPTDGEIVVTKTGDTDLDPSQVTTFDYDGFELYKDASGNLAVRAKTVDPEPTKAYYSFTNEAGKSYDTLVVNAIINGQDGTATEHLDTSITGGSLYLEITNIPANVTIKSVTLK